MNERRHLVVLLSFATLAYMAGFAALYLERVWPAIRAIGKALGA